MREYLDLEFNSIVESLSFEYNLERVIDDFVLLAVFIGNDFLPHLPDLHIHENGLERLFNIYKSVLPRAGGYINNSGVINTERLQMILDELSGMEVEAFYKEMGDRSWVAGKSETNGDTKKTRRGYGGKGLKKAQKESGLGKIPYDKETSIIRKVP
jgi:5'-3' exoribonuclease 1